MTECSVESVELLERSEKSVPYKKNIHKKLHTSLTAAR